ncbi:MAG TPA: GNAT family N-acetyltransferase [Casimicrobiaceae bacterium]|nr:GNAT family N-acetyltransferase [Casimicrobiaceae bacterium]
MSAATQNVNLMPRRFADDEWVDAPPWCVTKRLAFSEIAERHANELHELDSDPRVMQYIGSGRVSTREQIGDAVRRIPRAYAVYPGLGTWRATRLDNGDFVGWFALKYIPGTIEIEVGYRLRHAEWGRGYATEGTRALLRHGLDDLGLYRIIGITHPDNSASQRVLVKSGLVDAGWGHYYGRPVRVFECVRAAAWRPVWE